MRRVMPTMLFAGALLLTACAHTAGGAKAPAPDPRFAACEQVLLAQAEAWNRGDMQGYAAAYDDSDKTVFTSGKGTTLGYKEILERMRKGYPDRKAMGSLSFTGLTFRALGASEILVEGTWRLARKKDRPWGNFVLVMRKVAPGWRVVMDYTNLGGLDH
jgi:hypothetical protein